ncbi:MAG: 30S ribosomal protein S12 methylthiotransferase RimO [Acidobacteria bacterium]|nr:MAG: 30S ribosomal protein S12 methylthiotransferase RimO [Acidobacteriota bacterium]
MTKIGFVSLGCPKNLVDTEVMMGLVRADGYELTADEREAEIIVVNTCAFINPAKEESIETILEMAQLKKTGRCRKLIVAGCLAERYRDVLLQEMPEIDAVLGTNQVEDILRAITEEDARVVPSSRSRYYLYDHATPRVLATPGYTAYIKIAEGCDHTCDFCIIPRLRGPMRSRPIDSVVREAEALAARGVREVVLVGQDTTHYGQDMGLVNGLARLLRRLARIDGLQWIRFLYGYPHHVTDELLDVVASEERVCNYFDIPFQHVSERILRRMRRGGSRKTLERLIDRIRRRVPQAAIRTSFIVGYPGEEEEDFQQLLDHVRQVEYDHVGVFIYSDEEGTPAFEHRDKVPARVARARQKRLMKVQAQISLKKNKQRVGQRVKVLLEGYSEESHLLLQGRMASQAPEIDGCVLINDVPEGRALGIGEFVDVEITEGFAYDLVGRII